MTYLAPPVVRCSRCGGWIVSRVLHPEEPPGDAYVCALCGWDVEILGGQLVAISRAPDPDTKRAPAPTCHPHATPAEIAGQLAGQGQAS